MDFYGATCEENIGGLKKEKRKSCLLVIGAEQILHGRKAGFLHGEKGGGGLGKSSPLKEIKELRLLSLLEEASGMTWHLCTGKSSTGAFQVQRSIARIKGWQFKPGTLQFTLKAFFTHSTMGNY